ncbi:hypothetical protein HDV00_009752 [Rhizophlyctis rosea]|nr:hypothetical protein HDV00_009752 [Rhizophlyctis rosea]
MAIDSPTAAPYRSSRTGMPSQTCMTASLKPFKVMLTSLALDHPKHCELIEGAFVPIIKLVDQTTGLDVDVNFGTTGLPSVRRIQELVASVPLMLELTTLLKIFLRNADLNEGAAGGLGGYGTAIWAASFLLSPDNTGKDLGSVVLRFLSFYGWTFNFAKEGISLGGRFDRGEKSGDVVQRRGKSDFKARSWNSQIAILDPTDGDNNIGKTMRNLKKLRKVFQETHTAVQKALEEGSDLSSSYLSVPESVKQARVLVAEEMSLDDWVLRMEASIHLDRILRLYSQTRSPLEILDIPWKVYYDLDIDLARLQQNHQDRVRQFGSLFADMPSRVGEVIDILQGALKMLLNDQSRGRLLAVVRDVRDQVFEKMGLRAKGVEICYDSKIAYRIVLGVRKRMSLFHESLATTGSSALTVLGKRKAGPDTDATWATKKGKEKDVDSFEISAPITASGDRHET